MKSIFKSAFGAFFVALVSAVFAVSFAAIIYTGDLAPFLDRGIGLTLLGSVAIATVGAFTLSYRGSILAAQDVPAILLAGAATSLITVGELDGEILFATVACLVALASFTTGVVAVLVGQLKLAFVARFIPFPVLAGFLASTGLLLVLGGIGVAVDGTAEQGGLAAYGAPDVVFKWLPVLIAGCGMVFLTRRFVHDFTLPLVLVGTAIGFYVLLWAFGISMDQARVGGLVLGPFSQGGFLADVSPSIIAQADWGAIIGQAPVIVTIVATCLMGTTLNASGLELELRQDFDINTEVKGAGIANIVASFVGGLPGYHIVAETILAKRLGLVGRIAGISNAAGCAVLLLFGANILSGLPVGLFASVLVFLGLDLLVNYVWEERRKLFGLDFLTVLFIPAIAVGFSFLTAIAVGLLVACGFFIVSYSKLTVIRAMTDLGARRSYVERPDGDLRVLEDIGRTVKIIQLQGFLFFGSANALREQMQAILDQSEPKLRRLILDFKLVTGMDVSALRSLERLAADSASHGVDLTLTNVPQQQVGQLRQLLSDDAISGFGTLERALEQWEDWLISTAQSEDSASNAIGPYDNLSAMAQISLTEGFGELMHLEVGETLIDRGNWSNEIFFLRSGELTVSVPGNSGTMTVVAKVRAGSIVGEMAYYADRARSADIRASARSEIVRIDMDRMGDLETHSPDIASEFHKLIARYMARRLNRTTVLLRDLGMS